MGETDTKAIDTTAVMGCAEQLRTYAAHGLDQLGLTLGDARTGQPRLRSIAQAQAMIPNLRDHLPGPVSHMLGVVIPDVGGTGDDVTTTLAEHLRRCYVHLLDQADALATIAQQWDDTDRILARGFTGLHPSSRQGV